MRLQAEAWALALAGCTGNLAIAQIATSWSTAGTTATRPAIFPAALATIRAECVERCVALVLPAMRAG